MQQYPIYSMNNVYQPYQSQMQNPYMDRLAQLQAMQQQVQPQMQQQMMVPHGIHGKIVDDFNVITANDVPMDGSGAIFIKKDGSEIQVRNWTAQGTISTTSYTPVVDVLQDKTEITSSDKLNAEFEAVKLSVNTLLEKVDTISEKISDLAKTRSTRTKKEVEE